MGLRTKLIAATIFALTALPALAQPQLQSNRVRAEYVPPSNPAHQQIYETLKKQRVLERLSELLGPFRLPTELLLKVDGCHGQVNAFYEEAVVTVCYEYLKFINANAPDTTTLTGLDPKDATLGPTFDVFLHEAGHAVFDLLGIPMLGREEDAADMFSAYLQLQLTKEERRIAILGVAHLAHKEATEALVKPVKFNDMSDVHGHPAQRYFNVVCLAYGQDPSLFADITKLNLLPAERASGCGAEYLQLEQAFKKLILPHVDRELLTAVRTRKWLRPEMTH